MEKIITIKSKSESKYKEKGSVFIGKAYPVYSEDKAEGILASVRKEFYDATHHCFAYKLINNVEKYSDDGEPTGTAGIRILNAISHFEITNVLIVVVRYFGGVKLGVGPLGKAYYTAAFQCLETAEKIELTKHKEIKIKFNYDDSGKVHHILNIYEPKEIQNGYENNKAVITAKIQSDQAENFTKEILNATKNKSEVLIEQSEFLL